MRSTYDSGQSMHTWSVYERPGAPTSTNTTINWRDSSYSRCRHLSCHHSRRRSRSKRDIGGAFGSRLTMDGGALDGRVPKASAAGSADLGGGILFVHAPVAAADGRRCGLLWEGRQGAIVVRRRRPGHFPLLLLFLLLGQTVIYFGPRRRLGARQRRAMRSRRPWSRTRARRPASPGAPA